MSRKRLLLNLGLGVLVLGLGVAGVAALFGPRPDPNADLSTATVRRGSLDATVTASGNIISGATASLQPAGTGGIVTRIFVTTGDQVTRGERLLRIDDTAARHQLEVARVALRSAEASLQTATQGRTGPEQRADAASIAAARQNLTNAERALTLARAGYNLVRSQQADLVGIAQGAVAADRQVVDDKSSQLDALQEQLAAHDPDDATGIANLEAQIAQVEAELGTARASLAAAEATLAAARRTRDSAVQQAKQSLSSQTGARDSARRTLAQQRATAAVAQQGPKAGTVNGATAQVASARLQVEQARTALADTVLRAPFAGVVSTVNAVVGQSSSGSGSVSTGSTGLVVVVDPDGLSVTASIAEADATSVTVGQPVSVNLPASALDLHGEVVSVDIGSTVTNNVVQYLTTVALTDPPEQVRVGQTASLSIVTGSRDGVLFVPTSAITLDGGASYVTRLQGGTQTRVEVTTGLVGTTGTEILGGLAEGDTVVVPRTGTSSRLTEPLPSPGRR